MTESAEEEKNSKVLFSFATKNFLKIKNTRAITCSARAVREERAVREVRACMRHAQCVKRA